MKLENLSKRALKTITQLEKKTESIVKGGRMPALKFCSQLLSELNVEHTFDTTTYSPDIRPYSGAPYRTRDGIDVDGYELSVRYKTSSDRDIYFCAESSQPYYSWNTYGYASRLLRIVSDIVVDYE